MANSVESLLEQARAQQTQAAKDERAIALKSIGQNYNAGVENVNKAAAEAQRQNYITKEMQQRNIGQQLAAAGLNGGAAETTILGLANKYGENRRLVDADRINNVATLEAQKAQQEAAAQSEYNNLRTQIETNYATQLAAAKEAEAARELQREQAEADRAFQREMAAASAARSAAQKTETAINPYEDLGVSYVEMADFADDLAIASGGGVDKGVLRAKASKLIEKYGARGYEYLLSIAPETGSQGKAADQDATVAMINNALAAAANEQKIMNSMNYRK
jgi:hypothetical protein